MAGMCRHFRPLIGVFGSSLGDRIKLNFNLEQKSLCYGVLPVTFRDFVVYFSSHSSTHLFLCACGSQKTFWSQLFPSTM